MVGVLAISSEEAPDFIFLLDRDDVILFFKCKVYQYIAKRSLSL